MPARAVAAIVFAFCLVACAPQQAVDRSDRGLDGQGGQAGTATQGGATGGFQRGGVSNPPTPDGGSAGPSPDAAGAGTAPDAAPPADTAPDLEPDAEWIAPPLSESLAESCADLPPWEEGKRYEDGDAVVAGQPKHRFECRPWPYSPWCSLIHYRPGLRTTHWPDAWLDAGACPGN